MKSKCWLTMVCWALVCLVLGLIQQAGMPLVAGFGLKPMVGSMQRTRVWLAHCIGCRKQAIRSGSCWAAHIFGPRGCVE